jgi:hypothetical protein
MATQRSGIRSNSSANAASALSLNLSQILSDKASLHFSHPVKNAHTVPIRPRPDEIFRLEADRDAVRSEKLLRLRDGVLGKVKDARSQNCVCFSSCQAVQEML